MAIKIFLTGIICLSLAAIAALVLIARRSPRRAAVVSHLRADLAVLRHQRWRLLLYVFIIAYLQSVVGRSLAFYMHTPLSEYVADPERNLLATRLRDVGFALLPDGSESTAVVAANEFLQYFMAASIIGTGLAPYFKEAVVSSSSATSSPVFSSNVVVRLLQGIAVGHVLRMPAYLSTSLPGPAAHCVNPAIESTNHPRDLLHILWYPKTGANCGDLIFSGHVLFAVTATCTVARYVGRLFGPRRGSQAAAVLSCVTAIQALLAIASRSHYTVDIVTSLIISGLSWTVQARLAFPEDVTPDGANMRPFPPLVPLTTGGDRTAPTTPTESGELQARQQTASSPQQAVTHRREQLAAKAGRGASLADGSSVPA